MLVLLQLDNRTAVAYINNLRAQCYPVDRFRESRVDVGSIANWKLRTSSIFNKINQKWGPLEVDLFTTCLIGSPPSFHIFSIGGQAHWWRQPMTSASSGDN